MTSEDQRLNLPEREEKILEFWGREKIFEKTLERTAKGKPFIFYEGPPTANAAPGIHHVEARAFKDVIPRYKTMRGFFVPRKAGWDTHGLPVELQVEKELGLKTKGDIEKYGIAKFNERCRQSVWRYKEEWERLTRRIGFWLDLEHPYITYETSYVETLWWIIKEFWKRGFLYENFKIIPWCSRCQTGLSSHELGQPGAYKKVTDNSVFVRFRLVGRPSESLLVWTTTPWTLPANVAVAVNPVAEYTKFKIGNEYVWSATMPPYDAKGVAPEIVEKRSGKAFIGLEYEPPYREKPETGNQKRLAVPYKILGAGFVETDEGTGFVHLAPAFGEDDMTAVKEYQKQIFRDWKEGKEKIGPGEAPGLYPILQTVEPDGTMKKGVIGEGKFVKEADPIVIEDLKKRGLLFWVLPYEHDYPHCWRCSTPLIYYARNSWWVETTKAKTKLIENNSKVNWIPEHIKEGRFGEFLKDLRDWAFSRERYWGTPLPIWECSKCVKFEVIGSLADLALRAPKSGNMYFAVRHGESETQLLGITADSNSKYHLTDRGRKQIERTAQKLKKEQIDIIIHSDVLRTTEAAHILAEALNVKKVLKDPRIREVNVGVFNGKPTRDYHNFYSSREEYFEKAPPEGESLADLRARLMDFMADVERKHRNKKILIVSHEYPIWILDAASRGLDRSETIRIHDGKKDYIGLAEIMRIGFLNLPRDKTGEVNLHRPFVDEFHLECRSCGGKMVRVKDVADVWFDSGAMPFAQSHFPFSPVTSNRLLAYPADFIAEAVDQTRGWFYTLLAVATLLGKGASYRHVISLGHVLDKNGQKMSKSKGNVVNPWEMIQKYGADTIRWYFFTVNPPGEPKHFDEKDLLHKQRGSLSTFWNSFVLFDTYVDKIRNPRLRQGFGGQAKFEIRNSGNVLDRWITARLEKVTGDVTKALDQYDVVGAARLLEEFLVEDFSNWYLRRSRRRFQKPKTKTEKEEVAAVTGTALLRLAQLMAPFVPFLAEEVYQRLRPKLGLKEKSVHLCVWPLSAVSRFNFSEMEEVRKLVAAGLAERAKAGIKVRQPLSTLQITNHKLQKRAELLQLVKDEVNVKEIVFGGEFKLNIVITPELREEGWIRELVRNVQEMRKDLGLRPQHRIRLQLVASEFSIVAERWRKFIENETGAKVFQVGGKKIFKAEREFVFDTHEIWIGIDKT